LKLRELSREEQTAVKRAFHRWGVFEFFKDKSLLVDEGDQKKICMLSPGLVSRLPMVAPEYAGLVIGVLQKGFTPSIPGADLFVRHAKRNGYYVTVSDNAEQLVLYGRDVMGDSITTVSDTLDENELVIILNSKQEAIGIGRTRFAGKSILQKKKVTITTLADAGLYLRDEG
jgi:60S ribosome subunit biogenesis protein NIP7